MLNSPQFTQKSIESDERQLRGLTLHLLLQLPDDQRTLINWMRRREDCTLSQITNFMHNRESVVEVILQELLASQFVHINNRDGKLYYQVNMISMRQTRNQQTNTARSFDCDR